MLCANLDTLEPVEVRVATQIGIDTGRRPEDILDLPLDCLARDKDGGAVLVYDNVKANRLGRRLPISEATAAGDHRPAATSPATLPRHAGREAETAAHARRNPDGHKADQQ